MARTGKQLKSSPSTRFVLDCSLVFAWYFADESDPYADRVATSMANSEALVPTIWTIEVANTLIVGERRRRSTPAQATAFLSRLSNLPIRVDEHTSLAAWSGVLPLAREHQLSAYDAAYLDLNPAWHHRLGVEKTRNPRRFMRLLEV